MTPSLNVEAIHTASGAEGITNNPVAQKQRIAAFARQVTKEAVFTARVKSSVFENGGAPANPSEVLTRNKSVVYSPDRRRKRSSGEYCNRNAIDVNDSNHGDVDSDCVSDGRSAVVEFHDLPDGVGFRKIGKWLPVDDSGCSESVASGDLKVYDGDVKDASFSDYRTTAWMHGPLDDEQKETRSSGSLDPFIKQDNFTADTEWIAEESA